MEDTERQFHHQIIRALLEEEKDTNKEGDSSTSETPNETPRKEKNMPAPEKDDSAETGMKTQHKPRAATNRTMNDPQEYVPRCYTTNT